MRRLSDSARARVPQQPKGADLSIGSTKRTGGSTLVLLSICYWLIFYQYLPDNLAGMAAGGVADAANPTDRVIKIGMLALSLYAIATRWSLARSVSKNINLGAAAFLLLVPLSAAWSIERVDTLLRFVSLATIVLLSFAVSLTGWHRLRLQQLALPPIMFILLGSLVVGMMYPDRIVEIGHDVSQEGAWHGITHSKNEFGMIASLGVIICINRLLAWEGGKFWNIAGASVAFTCLLLSRSNAALLATMVGVFYMVLVMRVPVIKRRYSTHVAFAIAVTILLYELAIQNLIPGTHTLLKPITDMFGKDTTFSNRSVIWEVVKDHIRYAPYLGTGYGAYWIGPTPRSPSYIFTYLMYFYPSEAHNGYLDVVNDLGILGLICLFVFLFYYIRQGLQLMQIDRSQAAVYLALLFQQMVINMSESDWFSRSTTFAIFALAATCLSRGLLEGQPHAQSAGETYPQQGKRSSHVIGRASFQRSLRGR